MIYKATVEGVRPIIEMAQRFRECTDFILVDVETCVATYEAVISRGTGAVFGYLLDGQIVGALACIKAQDLHFPRMMAVETFWYVSPEHGSKGIGKSLFERFEEWAKEEKCDYTAMIHLADSYPETLEALYTRRGYKLTEKHYMKEVV
jgi:GNAT superfamily N-acetyltransferase